MRVVGAVLVVLMGLGPVAHARREAAPILVRLRGYVGAPPAGHVSEADLELRRDDETIRFQVDEARVLGGNVAGRDVLREIAPYKPSLTLSGPAEVLRRLDGVRAGERLEILGYYRRGARLLLVSAIERRAGS